MSVFEVIYLSLLVVGIVCYILVNRWQHKQVEFWKDAYFTGKNLSDQSFVYVIEISIRASINLEDYENARLLTEIKEGIIKNNPEADLLIRK